MTGAPFPYRWAQRVLRASAPLWARGSSKVSRGLRGRRAAARDLAAWGRQHRDTAVPCAWFHAPSVGEGLQARAVLEALALRSPELQAVYTHFSPSAEALARVMPAQWAGYLPWDLPDEVGPALDAVRPGALVFTKTEVWPELVAAARGRDVPVALVGGAVPPGARRSRWPARALLRPTWARLALVGAMSEADAQGFAELGVDPGAIRITGDPGVDSALARARAVPDGAAYLAPFREGGRPVVVAGSVWPSDLGVLVPALQGVRRDHPRVQAVVAPHEPSPEGVRSLLDLWAGRGWRACTLAQVEESGVADADVVVVDRVGALAHLYSVATVAFVGGGYHDKGLHSVLEPAAAGVPVCFGPRCGNARAAGDLLAAEGARVARDGGELARILHLWLDDGSAHDYAARRAFGYIDAHRGAADRSAALLEPLLTLP